jgi:hypothetical protein
VDTFGHASFGTVVMLLLQGIFTAPSWHPFTSLACGWALAGDRHTMTTSGWLTGATTVKHFARCDVFLGGPLDHKRWHLWGAVLRLAAPLVPEGEGMRVSFDETTQKKAGTPREGLARSRHGAGSARQAYRTLRGVHVVLGIMRMPRQRWPGDSRSVPVGLARSLQPEQAHPLHGPSRSRSQLARDILACVTAQVPTRHLHTAADGGDSTKDSVRGWPDAAHAVGRFPRKATLSRFPPKPTTKRRGAPRKKGARIGSPQTLAQTSKGWGSHPDEEGAEVHAWCGLWHAGWPGQLSRVVVVRREATHWRNKPGQSKPPPPVEAFLSPELSLSPQDILREYRDPGSFSFRWGD